MTIIQKLQVKNIIARIAREHEISVDQCRTAMAASIAEAWATTNSVVKQRQIQLVGEERVPTPEEFIVLISSLVNIDK